MKKIISFLIILTMLLSLAAVPANAAVSETEGITALLKELEIMQGDENGDMMLDKMVSRAEFAKIAIAASPQKNSVALGLRQSPFRDVQYTQWYAPYVKAAVSANYVVGYLDATFRPDNTVTYEEAATIMLRVLGYDDSAFTDAYPYGQLSKANNLSMLDNVDAIQGEELTRRQVMYLVYNTLNAKMNGASELISTHDCTKTEDVDVIAVSSNQNNLGDDEILTSKGTYKTGSHFDENSVGMKGDMYLKNNTDVVAFVPDTDNSFIEYETYFVYSVLNNETIIGYRNGKLERIEVPKNAKYYDDYYGTKEAIEKQPLSTKLNMGDMLYVKRKDNGVVDYVTYAHHEINGPIKVDSNNWLSLVGANNSSKVFRDGVESGISSISTNDIIYYSEPIDVVFAYTNKVTGIYENASPNKDTPIKVTISGKEYNIESPEAFQELSSSGSYRYGDTITLLLGRTGEVAGVAGTPTIGGTTDTPGVTAGVTAGFVIEAGKKDFTNADNTVSSSYYAKIVAADGTVGEYQTSADAKYLVCGTVRATFKNGKAVLSRSKNSNVYGKVNASKGVIGSDPVADNIQILDTAGTASDDIPLYKTVYLQRLDGVMLDSNSVLYSSKNSAGEIDRIILKDVTGDVYTYGVITRSEPKVGSYTIDIKGTQSTYQTAFRASIDGPCKLAMSDSRIKSMVALTQYSNKIDYITETEAVIGGQPYLISDDVIIYRKNIGEAYLKISKEEAISGDYKMTAYYDKAQSSGGRIRIIIAQDR